MRAWSVALRPGRRHRAWGDVIPPATLLLLALLAAGPLWGPGLLNTRAGGDSPFLLLRTHQLAANLRTGVFPVRWMPDAAYGFGYPFFSYYAALPYYLAGGFTLLGVDILSAIKLTQTLFFAAAALAMYGWARRVLDSRAGGWLAAVAYTFAPYHLINVYVRGDSLSELAAFAFFPLILWGLDRLAARPSLDRVVSPALAYAGLILTHNVSALIFSPFILLYVAFHILRFTFHVSRTTFHAPRTHLGKVLSSGSLLVAPLFIALLLSAWFWLPALAEIDDVQLTAQTSGYFFYGGHFRGGDLVQRKPLFDYAISPDGSSPFAMGLVQAVLALAGVFVVIVSWVLSQHATRDRRHATRFTFYPSRFAHFATHREAFILAGLTLSTYLITPLSRPLWDALPLLPMVQFPWRFLSVQALFAALFTGALAAPLQRCLRGISKPGLEWIPAAALAVLVGVAALAGLRPEYLPITADEVSVERLQLYELFTGNIGSTIRHEYLPRWVVPRPYTGPTLFDPEVSSRAIPISGRLIDAERVARDPTRRRWTVEAGADGAEIAFPLYYWPGWRAAVDGAPVDVRPAAGSGYLMVTVPSGTHSVEIRLGRTPLRAVAELMSLVTVLGLVALCGFGRRQGDEKTRRGGEGEHATRNTQHASHLTLYDSRFTFHVLRLTPFVSSAILLALLVALSPRVATTGDDDLTMDFERMPYLHHNPAGVDLDGWRMTGYSYSDDTVVPGEVLAVTLDWKGQEAGASARLRLVSPAAVRHDQLAPVAEATADLPSASAARPRAGSTVFELPIPDDASPGLQLIELSGVEGGTASVYLRPVWVESEEMTPEQPARGTFAHGVLRLHAVETAQAAPGQINVRLDWSAAEPVATSYGLSLRLTDPAGNEWTRLDTQPGYGFLPTSLWAAHRLVPDRYTLSLPTGIPPGDDYTLTVILYRAPTQEGVGRVTRPVALNRATRRPEAPILARFGDQLALSELKVPDRVRQGDTLLATAYWLALRRPSKDYVAEWRLEAAEGDQVVGGTLPLAPGSPPSSWPRGAWIAGRAALSVPPTAPGGDYALSLTLRDPDSDVSLGTYRHPQPVRVRERERVWELPAMQRQVGARFGDMIELAGYDLNRQEGSLRLTLHWRALETPDRNYVLFVHLADPVTGEPLAQTDTMPRGFTYPTEMWAPGEVVSDGVTLSLGDVPAGRYDLAVGWYDPDTENRLPAVDQTGEVQPGNRLILPDSVTLP